MQTAKISEINKLTIPEKILFLEELWDTIAIHDSEIPVPESHKSELDKRLKRHLDAPGQLLTLDELQERIERRK
ncbi:MAG: addiction module protein [Deltaproteobacteria bacterium]|nr:addiction module protein [Deltaproteobacteria bacterium]